MKCVSTGWYIVSAPDPTDAAADGLHHRYPTERSGDVIHPQLRPLGLGPRLGGTSNIQLPGFSRIQAESEKKRIHTLGQAY